MSKEEQDKMYTDRMSILNIEIKKIFLKMNFIVM